MLETLKELCLIDGTSGREDAVRKYIINRIKDKCEYSVDPMGNVLAFKKGKNTPKKKVMLSAHMDEVGFIVTYICSNGFLRFTNVGGIDGKVVNGRAVTVGENRITGIIGNKALHLTEGDEDKTAPNINKLYIDIGASSKAEAEKLVSIGDSVYFKSDFILFGDNKVKAKAIDDRFGCAVMLEMIEQELTYDTHFAFLVQEEVGCRGAKTAAFSLNPDVAIATDVTIPGDSPGIERRKAPVFMGEGPVVVMVSASGRGHLADPRMVDWLKKTAKKHDIKIQIEVGDGGNTDASAINFERGGIPSVPVSVPARYIHSPVEVIDLKDLQGAIELLRLAVKTKPNF